MSAGPSDPKRPDSRLSPEDMAIWNRVVDTLNPLHTTGSRLRATAVHAPGTVPRTKGGETFSRPSSAQTNGAAPRIAPLQVQAPPARNPGPVGRPEPGLDRRTADRLRKGARTPDARIDLHGLTAARAHHRLDAFMSDAVARGHRCVLVITGKGGRVRKAEDAPFMTPDRGVLRDAAPSWLRSGRHRDRIVGIYEAHQRHGGGGAFYVYLKKRPGKS